jgi:hypothetical protein
MRMQHGSRCVPKQIILNRLPRTTTDPVPPGTLLIPRISLSLATSADHACFTRLDRVPAASTARLNPSTPWPTLNFIDVADTHSVALHPASPPRPRPVYATVPITITDTPSLARGTAATVLISWNSLVEGASCKIALPQCAVAETACCPTVATADRLENNPAGTLQVVWVLSDTQWDASHAVNRIPPGPVASNRPVLVPAMVKEVETPAHVIQYATMHIIVSFTVTVHSETLRKWDSSLSHAVNL